MEHPQPRPSKTEGQTPTHDFLSLYSRSDVNQYPRPPFQGGYLKTHDFLQPLERIGKTGAKEESVVEISALDKPPPPAPPPSVEHILPGGIGTYSISHISCFNQTVPKPEGPIFTVARAGSSDMNDENSNCNTSYTASGFTLWEESHAPLKKGKTRKENMGENPAVTREAGVKLGPRTTVEGPSQSSTNNHHRNSFCSLSSSEAMGQKKKSFVEMITSSKCVTEEDDLDDEEVFVPKKESSAIVATTHKGELRVKLDGFSDQKVSTPRSKHSATEQRRRSKINDRFQMLRELIPRSDQKRDKASFLFEVIEYVQFLQEKVEKYEGAYQGWNHEKAKLMPRWRNNHRPVESHVDQSRMDHHPGIINQAMTLPMSPEPNFFATVKSSAAVHEIISKLASDAEKILSQPQPLLCDKRSGTTEGIATSNKLKERELTVEDGTISISSVYSQRLLSNLTQALQNSGVDLSRASISVQIDLGKQSNSRAIGAPSAVKDISVPSGNSGKQGTTCTRVANAEDSDRVYKKLKTGKT